MNKSEEASLIDQCLKGDRAAWDRLFAEHYAPVFRFAFQLSHSITHEDAEEICQETFLAAIRNLGTFKGGSALQTWLFRIASNKTRDLLEKRSAAKRGGGTTPLSLDAEHPETGQTLDPASPARSPDAEMVDTERLRLVHSAVQELDEPCREIVELRYFGDLSYEQLAGALDLNPKTVSSRLSRCLDRLETITRGLFSRENIEAFPV